MSALKSQLPSVRHVTGVSSLICLSFIFTWSYLRGRQIEARAEAALNQIVVPKLLYGSNIPHFEAVDTDGKLWKQSDFQGHWTLISVASLTCQACDQQLKEIERDVDLPQGGQKISVTYGTTVIGSLAGTAKAKHAALGLSFPMLVDKGGISSQLLDSTHVPFTILLDKEGRVRMVFDGFKAGRIPETTATLTRQETISLARKRRPFPLTSTLTEEKTEYQFNDVIRRGWTVLTFAKTDCSGCNERASELARFPSAEGFHNILVYATADEARAAAVQHRSLPGFRHMASPSLFRSMKISSVPFTAVFFNGSLAHYNEGSLTDDMWLLLGAARDGRVRTDKELRRAEDRRAQNIATLR